MKHPIHKVLIANRGEIAARIIRTCQKMGIESVAIYSDADRDAPFVQAATYAYHLGASPASSSYLNIERILEIAQLSAADAIHPGYGFLSEQAAFAQAVLDKGLRWIGPHPQAIAQMGSKMAAKVIMEKQGVPTIPGYQGDMQSQEHIQKEADRIGFPILIKASAGGGGKGMRVVDTPNKLAGALQEAKAEALKAFGDEQVILEKYLENAAHVEFQILGDQAGNLVHLFERECSVQRRHQKIIEETPAPNLLESTRAKMAEAALLAAKAIQYDNAGTVEFLLAPDQSFYFLEVNTRLQVEHGVTELVTGLDLVELQIKIAEGQSLPFQQSDIQSQGHAIECRLYAENPTQSFLPETGKILLFETPKLEGVRYDIGVQSGQEVSTYYDPMLAKVMAWGPDRISSLRKLNSALQGLKCVGLQTNQQYLRSILLHPEFVKGALNTRFIETHQSSLLAQLQSWQNPSRAAIAACIHLWDKRRKGQKHLRNIPSGWRNNSFQAQQQKLAGPNGPIDLTYQIEGMEWKISINQNPETLSFRLLESGSQISFEMEQVLHRFEVYQEQEQLFVLDQQGNSMSLGIIDRFPLAQKTDQLGAYLAPMPGEVVAIHVQEGDRVTSGQTLLTLYSMKMEMQITAQQDGIVKSVSLESGQSLKKGDLLLELDALETS